MTMMVSKLGRTTQRRKVMQGRKECCGVVRAEGMRAALIHREQRISCILRVNMSEERAGIGQSAEVGAAVSRGAGTLKLHKKIRDGCTVGVVWLMVA